MEHPVTVDEAGSSTPPVAMPRMDFGGAGSTLLFLHANGYPPACYRPLLTRLARGFHVVALLQRPLWPNSNPLDVRSWQNFSDDFLRFLAKKPDAPVLAVGHSLGATVALTAAFQAPERFAALILVEPVLFTKRVPLFTRMARTIRARCRIRRMIRGALSRRRIFDNLDQVYEAYRRRQIFRYLSDENLRTYIAGITAPSADGYRLLYPPEWEARVYYTSMRNDWDLWGGIASLSIPTLMIRGRESDTFPSSMEDEVRARNTRIQIVAVAGATHLAPLERPEHIGMLCAEWLAELRQVR